MHMLGHMGGEGGLVGVEASIEGVCCPRDVRVWVCAREYSGSLPVRRSVSMPQCGVRMAPVLILLWFDSCGRGDAREHGSAAGALRAAAGAAATAAAAAAASALAAAAVSPAAAAGTAPSAGASLLAGTPLGLAATAGAAMAAAPAVLPITSFTSTLTSAAPPTGSACSASGPSPTVADSLALSRLQVLSDAALAGLQALKTDRNRSKDTSLVKCIFSPASGVPIGLFTSAALASFTSTSEFCVHQIGHHRLPVLDGANRLALCMSDSAWQSID